MPRLELNIDPCDHVTADAIGQPGQRVFFLQAWKGKETYTVLIEKVQLQSLSSGIEQFLAQVIRQYPELEDVPGDYVEEEMHVRPPLNPLFRAGELGLGYDAEHDRVLLFVREILIEGQDPQEASVLRIWCTRRQLRKLARWGAEVVSRGRPICPQCGEPMEPEGHFCVKKNGHKR
uniref:Hypothetical conserved protein n=1 Tax=uncultured Chloroflexota bacterium TaxID=166587 RepID=H5SMV1_9CHLR|nr:hypothetical conserved protein [uncultured Chloroflexota bacterium]